MFSCRMTQIIPPRDCSFLTPKIRTKFELDHPIQGRQMQVEWVKIGHFRGKSTITRKWCKIGAYTHSFYQSRIGSHMHYMYIKGSCC